MTEKFPILLCNIRTFDMNKLQTLGFLLVLIAITCTYLASYESYAGVSTLVLLIAFASVIFIFMQDAGIDTKNKMY